MREITLIKGEQDEDGNTKSTAIFRFCKKD